MVERLVLYDDTERTVVSEVRERFNRRRDKLRERRVFPQKVCVHRLIRPSSSVRCCHAR